MKILVVGQGGREHAMAWALARSARVSRVFCAPGNDGMAREAKGVQVSADDIAGLLSFAKKEGIDLTVVGPEAPLAQGLVDRFQAEGLRILGPDRHASQLESSKVFAKRLMAETGVPTASYSEFTVYSEAEAYVRRVGAPVVIKANGLCQGKGVTVAQTQSEAVEALSACLVEGRFGDAGKRVLVEERLEGEEATLMAISDGDHVLALAPSQDHKRVFDGDRGPNTGGMGAYSPAPIVSDEVIRISRDKVFLPVVRALKRQGHPFVGFLYAGVMIKDHDVRVLEFNVRLGDPECQAILPRLETDFADLLVACHEGRLDSVELRWKKKASVCVVISSQGYPGSFRKGDRIRGLDEVQRMSDVFLFHAGTKRDNGDFYTAGGRVLNIVGMGEGILEARRRAYEALAKIHFEGMHFRKDIASRALNRQETGVPKWDSPKLGLSQKGTVT